jgi:hypothetical protein
MNFKTIVAFHYHWLPGGVRSAVEKSLKALTEMGSLEGMNVHLVVGDMHQNNAKGTRGNGVNLHMDNFRNTFSGHNFSLKITEDNRLNYTYNTWPDEKTFRSAASDLAEFFLGLGEKQTVFWLHNVNLCKNPLVTKAWIMAAQLSEIRRLPYWYLFHIHDFAECGRLDNLVRTRFCWGTGGISNIYPNTANAGFAVLSAADKHKLAAAGVHKERIFHIPNVISKPSAEKKTFKSKKTVSKLLSNYAKGNGYRFNADPETKWWLLPIRLIRRKNILEAIVLGTISGASPQLLLTLYANSQTEMPYADNVNDVVKQNNLPLVIAFGQTLIDEEKKITFSELMECTDAVISTSLMEGFGYAFTDPVLNNKPLIGRNLENATIDLAAAGFPASELYDEFLVPINEKIISPKDIVRLKSSGRTFAERYMRLLSISKRPYEQFLSSVEGLFNTEAVDFGMLNLELQLNIVSHLQDKSLIDDLKMLNPGLPHTIDFEKDMAEKLTNRFGPEKNAARIIESFNKLPILSKRPVGSQNISHKLLDLYFTPSYQRPLYSGW